MSNGIDNFSAKVRAFGSTLQAYEATVSVGKSGEALEQCGKVSIPAGKAIVELKCTKSIAGNVDVQINANVNYVIDDISWRDFAEE